jgi:hypothetical protein
MHVGVWLPVDQSSVQRLAASHESAHLARGSAQAALPGEHYTQHSCKHVV